MTVVAKVLDMVHDTGDRVIPESSTSTEIKYNVLRDIEAKIVKQS